MYELKSLFSDLSTEDHSNLLELITDRGEKLSPEEFLENVSLEDDFSYGSILGRSSPEFYRIEFNPGEYLYCIKSDKIEASFSMNGKSVNFKNDFDEELSFEIKEEEFGWLLSPSNSIYAQNHMGTEFIRVSNSDIAVFDGTEGYTRIQLIVDGKPVCALSIQDDDVENIYTKKSEVGKKYPEQLFQQAQGIIKNLRYSDKISQSCHDSDKNNDRKKRLYGSITP